MSFPNGPCSVMAHLGGRIQGCFCAFALACLVSSCAIVKPAERGRLAEPSMESPFDGKHARRAYENKVLQTLTGSELPAGAPGGGCGCVN